MDNKIFTIAFASTHQLDTFDKACKLKGIHFYLKQYWLAVLKTRCYD